MVDLAETTVDIKVSAGDTGVVDLTIRVDDFFKATITALNTNFSHISWFIIDAKEDEKRVPFICREPALSVIAYW